MPRPDRTVTVTTVGRSRADDRRLRTRRYLITQGIRVACLLLAVLLPVEPVWKIGFIAGSIVLPWFGVVAANAGPTVERRRQAPLVVRPVQVDPPSVASIDATRVIDHE
jgi:hypothetical protein